MKHLAQLTLVAFVAMMISSCIEEVENKTVVHSDGSITRTIVFTGDSSAIAAPAFKLPVDSTWTFTKSRQGKKSWVLTVEQTFRDVQAMNNALRGEPGKSLTATVRLEKSFQWFFTSYRYTETWKCYRLVNAEPLDKYFSKQELDLLYRHEMQNEPYASEDSLLEGAAKKKSEEWRAKNLFEAYYKEFLRGVEIIHSPLLTPSDVESHKDELYQASAEKIEKAEKDVKMAQEDFDAVLRTPIVAEAFHANELGFKQLVNALDFEESIWMMGSFKVVVSMPGVITSTNASALDGSNAHWDNFIGLADIRDTDLAVESRSVNWWTVGITGVVAAAILAYLTVALLRRKAVS